MKKESYRSLDSFTDSIKPIKIIESNEAHIFITGNFVYKIFDRFNVGQYYCKKSHILGLQHLNSEMFTIPVSLIYINNRFLGFKMINCGESLNNQFIEDKLSFNELVSISEQLKDIQLYLTKKSMIHGDIQLDNLLYKNGKVTLTDINSASAFPTILNGYKKLFWNSSNGSLVRVPDDFYFWSQCYGPEYLDYLETNYCTFLLLNFSPSEIIKLNDGSIDFKSYKRIDRFLMNPSNNKFEDDVFDYFMNAFSGEKKKLSVDIHLVDHLKR